MTNAENYWFRELSNKGYAAQLKEHWKQGVLSDGKERSVKEIPETLMKQLVELTKNSDFGIHIFFMAALHLVVRKYQLESEVVIITPRFIKGTNATDMYPLFIASDTTPELTVRSFLNFIREKVLQSHSHQDYEKIELKKIFEANNLPDITDKPGIVFTYTAIQDMLPENKETPLSVVLHKREKDYVIAFDYQDNFLAGFFDQFAKDFSIMLESLLMNLDATVGSVLALTIPESDFITKGQQHRIGKGTLTDLFKLNVNEVPGKRAVCFQDESLTYSQLDTSSDRLARYLQENHDLKEGGVVAICSAANINYLIAAMAILKAGGIVLSLEKSIPKERIEYMLSNSRSRLMLTEQIESYDGIVSLDIGGVISKLTSENLGSPYKIAEQDLMKPCFIIYTSGSTGNPKGVLLNHHNLINQFEWFRDYFDFSDRDVLPQKSSINFIDSLTELFLPITICNGTVYLRPYEDINRDTKDLVKWFQQIGVTILLYVPSLFEFLAGEQDIGKIDTLNHLVLGGEEVKRLYDYDFKTYNLYGNSECASISTIYELTSSEDYYKLPIGKPIYNTSIYILDEKLNALQPFIIGEIYIGGAGVGMGYINNETLTEEKFLTDPFQQGGSMYKTGDFGRRLPDGNIEYIGRKDKQIKIRGIRIDIEEIENKIRQQIDISDIAVLSMGESHEKHLAAVCICKKGGDVLTEQQIKQKLLSVLPPYLVPVEFLILNEMPLTASGKIDRKILPDLLKRHKMLTSAPVDELEKELVVIWETVLGRNDIGTSDNFFRVGGQSLNMIQVLYKIKNWHGIAINLNSFIETPTIKGLADIIREKSFSNQSIKSDIIQLNKIRPGRIDLIMLHPFNGIAIYNALAEKLEDKVNLYGLNAPGIFDASVSLPDRFEEVAQLYVDRIFKYGFKEGFCLCGYSSSIPLVFEITKIFELSGMHVPRVIMVDDYFRASTRILNEGEKDALLHSELFHCTAHYLDTERRIIDDNDLFDLGRVFEKYTKAKGGEATIGFEELRHYIDVITKMFRLQMQYHPSGRIRSDIFYLYTEKYGADLGWQTYTSGNFHLREMKGEHNTIFNDNNIEVNSEIIEESLVQQQQAMA